MLGGAQLCRGNTAGAAARFAAACAKKEPETHPENIVLVDDGLDCDGDALRDMIKDMAAAERAKAEKAEKDAVNSLKLILLKVYEFYHLV